MSNPIPPLVCDTPPPIDDDFEPFDDFTAFGSEEPISPREEKLPSADIEIPLPEVPVVVEPPVTTRLPPREDPIGASDESPIEQSEEKPRKNSLPTDKFSENESQVPDDTGQGNSSENIPSPDDRLGHDLNVKRCESPPSLVLSEDFSCFPEDAQVEGNSDSADEVSLPSLHLDSGNVSKSATPTFIAQAHAVDNTETFVISEDDKVESEREEEEDFDDFAAFSSAPSESNPATIDKVGEEDESLPKEDQPPEDIDEESVSIPAMDFVADFSQFSTQADNPEGNEGSSSVVVSWSENQSVDNQPKLAEDDDDEFGDFSDFQQPEAAPEAVIDTTNLNSQFQSALNLMFPRNGEDEKDEQEEEETKIEVEFIQKNQILEDLRDFESSKALQYQWQNSSSNQSLIRSLGIDSRNILYGGKWNSSMPRFAANLGFSPLQPMKPSAGSSMASSQHHPGGGDTEQQQQGISLPRGMSEVPAAQFDWTSAGLVNPLDGSPKVLPKSNNPKDPKEQPESIATSTPSVAAAAASAPSEFTSDVIVMEKEVSAALPSPPPPVVTPSFSHQPLRETHIFTPSKSVNPISREISDHPAAASATEGKIIVKEYHDVEYNPEKVRVDEDFSEFTEFQGSPPTVEKPPEKVAWREPPTESPYHRPAESISEFTRPTFGVSPTEEMVNGMKDDQMMKKKKAEEEDDFCDFQSVTPHSTTNKQQPIPAPILQPLNVMKLSESGPKIAWPSPGINPDEMARLEAIYPQKSITEKTTVDKNVAIIPTKSKEEDEWSDFVSGTTTSTNRDDDWTDFISSAPAPQKSLQQGPNFSSWTTPQLPPPQFTAWHNSNIFQQQTQQFQGMPVVKPPPTMPMVNNNNNFSSAKVINGQINGFPLVGSPLATISSGNRPRFTNASSISVIPDMSFRAPKSLINLPRTGYTKK